MQQMNVNELKPHPRNNEFFDDMTGEKWEEFLESIKTRGVVEPIVITPDKVIVSGHQRVRACKELGIKTVMCDVHAYDNDDQILQDLIETNIRQRGSINDSEKKKGKRIRELERIYGIGHGGDRKSKKFYGNQYKKVERQNSSLPKTQEDLAKSLGMSVDTLQNYKLLTEMIPELEELVDTGIVSATTAIAIIKTMSPEQQLEMFSQMDVTKRITRRAVEEYKKAHPPKVIDNTDYAKIDELQEKIKELEIQKRQLETKVKMTEEDAQKFAKLKSEIEFLSQKKTDLDRQIKSATELSQLTVSLQKVLEKDLAPIKFKRCMDELEQGDVALTNLLEILDKVGMWYSEMNELLKSRKISMNL